MKVQKSDNDSVCVTRDPTLTGNKTATKSCALEWK